MPVHELGVDGDDQLFYTMKFVRGVTLAEVVAGLGLGRPEAARKYPLATLLTIFQKVCDAVAFAHSRGVWHRDLKPENIMIGDYGEVLVMDWGLAKEAGFGRAEPSPGEEEAPADTTPGPDDGRHGAGHADLHGAGAGARGGVRGGPPGRRLCVGRYPARNPVSATAAAGGR